MATLSVIVNTKNSGTYLRGCLESATAIADEIVLVDMASTDDTLAIAAAFPKVSVYQYPEPEIGYADPAREYAFARAHGDWLLIVDSDEELPPALARTLRRLVDGQPVKGVATADIYYLPRHNEIFGAFIEGTGWYPDYQLRLWRRGQITWRPGVHSQPKIHGTTAYLPSEPRQRAIIHHNYQSVAQFVARANKYSDAAASARASTCAAKNLTPDDLWQSFFDELWRRGFRDGGLLEGNHGVSLSLLQAAYELTVTAKTWQARGFSPAQLNQRQLRELQRRFFREAHYWWADLQVRQTHGLARCWWRLRRKLKV